MAASSQNRSPLSACAVRLVKGATLIETPQCDLGMKRELCADSSSVIIADRRRSCQAARSSLPVPTMARAPEVPSRSKSPVASVGYKMPYTASIPASAESIGRCCLKISICSVDGTDRMARRKSVAKTRDH
jgi:hypothetical protein